MLRFARRRPVENGVRFCEECAEVTTATQRADLLRERTRTRALAWMHIR